MKKKSYRNKAFEAKPSIRPEDIPTPNDADEGYSGSNPEAGAAGFIFGDPVSYHEQEDDPYMVELDKDEKINSTPIDINDLTDMLLAISDEMDKQADYDLANFSDFLIKKIAQQRGLNHSSLLRDLLSKIVESDLVNQNKILINITSIYNLTLKEQASKGVSIKQASELAYNAAALKVREYVK